VRTKEKQTVAKRAATLTVHPTAGRADFTTIAAAVAALPAAGGVILLLEGTYSLAATVTLTDKPITILGAGRGATIIDLGANAIVAFTVPNDREYTFAGFSIHGNGALAGQKAFAFTNATGNTKRIHFNDLSIGGDALSGTVSIEAGIDVAAASSIEAYVTNCNFRNLSNSASNLWKGNGKLHMRGVTATGSGIQDVTSLEIFATDCNDINLDSGNVSAREMHFTRCTLTGTVGLLCEVVASTFTDCTISLVPAAASQQINLGAADAGSSVKGCKFSGAATRCINIGGSETDTHIIGNDFGTGYTSEAVRTTESRGVIMGNSRCKLLEATGAADGIYADITIDSTIIAASNSRVDNYVTETFTTGTHGLDRNTRTALGNTSGGNITFNLPAAATARHHRITIKKINASNSVTIDGNASETIDGATTKVLTADDAFVEIQSDGTEWHIIAESAGSGGGGAPGTWTQLGKGPTSVANDTEVTVLSGQTLSSGEVPVFHYGMQTTPTNTTEHVRITSGALSGGGGEATGVHVKLSGGNWDFRIHHADGGARDFDWQALKVTPA